ncbi:bacillithiol biosynthesis cysteine-adding enzyme BshC [Rossellomorea aquimaris]|uniref:Putative cysteine ligase BshC n=1 Tax=Rossellomorea aquimaris TaxID=189382 RepID=A0A5D4TZJ0_9BACI|nr:bacillithiol biosynthesis cysteine-adding enzyme BshC [Rossellomorea aquimaris]TYS80429.1 bacillithiol biosynthesis cysteine-adding enzyme BshC [Rossellomorea aquimaris]TYS85816.1 bacillithiol biosynthesis cysteine-adding enzyme BshC [Rossellomorea aquimaris]
MEVESLNIPAINKFASQYLKQEEPVTSFFHYNVNSSSVYSDRMKDLASRQFEREGLAECISSYMKSLPSSEKVEESLGKLRNDAVTVIAGQQAGLMTGPLYTIHKIISVIQLARQQEAELKHPVVPVFWIAGEDHDYQEVNHLYVEKRSKLEKVGYPERVVEKKMTSHIMYNKTVMKKWLHDILVMLGETEHTNQLSSALTKMIEEEEDIVRFFAHIVMSLFKDFGLLVIDSAYPLLRKLESRHFHHLIENSQSITDKVLEQQEEIRNNGYGTQLDISPIAANLFIQLQDERALLEREGNKFFEKNSGKAYSSLELLSILDESPESFSNNVVTRPMMQEWLFPTLAFVAGPGEIAYWGELKKAFEYVDLKMPPVVPRLNITIVEREIEKRIQDLQLTLHGVITEGVSTSRNAFWKSLERPDLEFEMKEIQEELQRKYEKIREKAVSIDQGLHPIIDKNLEFHLSQFDYLRNKVDKALKDKNSLTFNHFMKVENSIRPNEGPQERTWNVLYFLNKYGPDFVKDLTLLEFTFDGTHKVVYI